MGMGGAMGVEGEMGVGVGGGIARGEGTQGEGTAARQGQGCS